MSFDSESFSERTFGNDVRVGLSLSRKKFLSAQFVPGFFGARAGGAGFPFLAWCRFCFFYVADFFGTNRKEFISKGSGIYCARRESGFGFYPDKICVLV